MMTSLSALCEAAKVIEYEDESGDEHSGNKTCVERERVININNRVTHNILEKNRRAELKNFFQRLKESVPKLKDKQKASNVSILTESMKYIQELNRCEDDHQEELKKLRRSRIYLEQRVKMLQEEIQRESLHKQLFAQVDVEQKRVSPSPEEDMKQKKPTKAKMMSVEVQANEYEIRAAFPEFNRLNNITRARRPEVKPRDWLSIEVQTNDVSNPGDQKTSEQCTTYPPCGGAHPLCKNDKNTLLQMCNGGVHSTEKSFHPTKILKKNCMKDPEETDSDDGLRIVEMTDEA